MAVTIKSPREIACMREAGRLLAEVHEELGRMIRPGISTKHIPMPDTPDNAESSVCILSP